MVASDVGILYGHLQDFRGQKPSEQPLIGVSSRARLNSDLLVELAPSLLVLDQSLQLFRSLHIVLGLLSERLLPALVCGT